VGQARECAAVLRGCSPAVLPPHLIDAPMACFLQGCVHLDGGKRLKVAPAGEPPDAPAGPWLQRCLVLMRRCWRYPAERPSFDEIVDELVSICSELEAPPPPGSAAASAACCICLERPPDAALLHTADKTGVPLFGSCAGTFGANHEPAKGDCAPPRCAGCTACAAWLARQFWWGRPPPALPAAAPSTTCMKALGEGVWGREPEEGAGRWC